ncbi:hypothetical protein ACFO25_02765 [Paenactinomyces guangxiensis]|uniref:Uncharacterized protein n=1 Tax=Paenactinomyces guangxiensis TaxID=1490290 RepID=A0A7W1WT49_9BACL|nr:hypothetical protein [Paenactinomyces guangxiensis]MBA4495606.1 hypothetical protein [Paenactinomyces guangxiensis]MBH8592594.1 hypothetical protein [Paenactinomyces guangxiensis]
MKALARRMFATIFLSVLLVSLLSLIPMLSHQRNSDSEFPVFQQDGEKKLYREHLVDFLLSQSVQMEIKRVDLNQGALYVEMVQAPHLNEEGMYREVFQIIKNSLVGTDNIQTIRLYIHNPDRTSFMVEAKRQHIQKDPRMKNARGLPLKQYLEEMFEITKFSF